MTITVRLVMIGAAMSLAAAAPAQDRRVVTKTLVVSEAQKECISLNNKQRLLYKFRADGPVSFKLSHLDEKEVIDLKRDATGSASGSFAPRASGDHCLVWTNTGKRSVTLRYEYQRGSQ
ncbi:MAG TPA: hypothetical protein VMS53_00120 [Burkholderiales bacterium]|jgi:hypothetical protein|nr:hypothetical protein [Burkholderiales bacterium]